MPRTAEEAGGWRPEAGGRPARSLIRHGFACLVGAAGTVGVFALSLGMNAQVERRAPEVATIVESVAGTPRSPPARKQRSSPVKKARASAPNPAPLLSASLSGLDFGLDAGADAAIAGATTALLSELGGAVLDEDEVEVAPRVVARTAPAYPARARSQGLTGAVTLAFVVDVDGTVQDIHVVTPPGVFDTAAIDAVQSWRFEPGQHQGAPVAVRVRQTVRFELE